MRTSRSFAVLVVAVAAALSMAPAVHAGVVLVSRTSTLALSRDAAAGTVDETRSTNEFGRFNDRLAADEPPTGEAAQDTTFELAALEGLHGFGRMETFAGVDEEPGGPVTSFSSIFDVFFDVVGGPEPYAISGAFFNSNPRVDTSRIFLVDDGGSGDVVFRVTNGGFPDSTETNPSFAERGELAPGRYRLFGETGSAVSDAGTGGENAASADFDFAVGATVIPLPPAVMTGALGLLAAAAAAAPRATRSRRRAAPRA